MTERQGGTYEMAKLGTCVGNCSMRTILGVDELEKRRQLLEIHELKTENPDSSVV
ncbi:hypothetical protein CCACVL1_04982 [Corchorus capsularis]|uniref:Uncharacterized protein n=1 Tax=Corchorus capsularis TaxID=210143 RepID=A0A1R3JNB8_COCAP|nr:hypothetical protein CCACVL1_04982 [Corchorus capsularis]